MTPDAMHELSTLLRAGDATLEERGQLMDAASDVDELDELTGAAAATVASLRTRAAGDATDPGVTASARAFYGAHAFELYGLEQQPQPLVGLYGLGGHDTCDPFTFCRNPLHPGPCKGWKHTLKAVAPGVHAQIEEDRLARVHARREDRRRIAREGGLPEPKFRKLKHEGGGAGDRKGLGKGRDADKDGKFNEGEYVKKGRKKAAVKPEPPADEAGVKIQADTRRAVTAAVKILPKGSEGWAAQLREPYQEVPWQRLVSANQSQLDVAKKDLEASQASWIRSASSGWQRQHPGGPPIDDWADLKAKRPDLAQEWEATDGKAYRRDVKDAQERVDYTQEILDQAETQIAGLGGRKPDGGLPDGFVMPRGSYKASDFESHTKYRPRAIKNDRIGTAVPDDLLVKQHAAVQKAGELIHRDIAAAIENDPEVARIMKEWRAANALRHDYTKGRERMEAGKEADRLQRQIKAREREIVVEALSHFRPMGGEGHTGYGTVNAISSRNDLAMIPGNVRDYELARGDWEAQLAEADRHFPDDWVRKSRDAKMDIVSGDRASHRGRPTNWLPEVAGQTDPTLLSMNTDFGAAGVVYGGAFPSYVHEVTYHEMGHRMESQIPGLSALEYAYVRSKTTHNGIVEGTVKLQDVYGGSYTASEVSYKDQFPDLYTGKTYEARGADPALTNWEAFQVGLQQTMGRSDKKYGDDSLEHFVLGTLATLGRN